MRLAVFFLTAVLSATLAAQEVEQFTGEVLIQNSGPRTVLAFIQSDATGVSQVIRLSAEQPFPQNPISFHFQRASIQLGARQVIINSQTEPMNVIFAVTDLERPEEGIQRQPASRDCVRDSTVASQSHVLTLRGYWLGRHSMAPGRAIGSLRRPAEIAVQFCDASVSAEDCLDNNGDPGTGGGGSGGAVTCSSGGPGSTACSCGGGGCSVSCGAGYYACCKDCDVLNGSHCSCVRNN